MKSVRAFAFVFGVVSLLPSAFGDEFPREKLDDTGFVSIFDGKSLAGWHVSADTGHSGTSGHKSGGRWVVETGRSPAARMFPATAES